MRFAMQKITTSLALLLVLTLGTFAVAQEAADPGPALGGAAGQQRDAAAAANNLAWSDMLKELQLLRAEVQTLQSSVTVMETRMDATEDGLKRQLEINDQLAGQLNKMLNQLEVIASNGNSGSTGGIGNVVRSIQEDPKMLGDFQKVVQGKVIFENKTGKAQRLFINGSEWEVIPGRSSMFVPYGQVMIHTRAGTGPELTAFNVDNWTKVNDQLVLNVPLLESPTPAQQ